MASPAVVFNLKYFSYDDTSDANKFYRCKTDRNILGYIGRDSSHNNLSEEEQQIVNDFVECSNKSEGDILEYAKERPGSQGLFGPDGKLSDSEVAAVREKMAATKATIYSSVISFSTDFGENFLTTNEEGRNIINSSIKHLFKDTKFDLENIEWLGAVHTNKTHHHIHFVFFEKEPKNINSKGQPCFVYKQNLPKKNIEMFKSSILNHVKENHIDYYSLRDSVRNGFVNSLHSDQKLFETLVRSCSGIIENGHFQYARLNKEDKKKIDGIVKSLLSKNPPVNATYEEYKKKLKATHQDYLSLLKENGDKYIPKEVKDFYSTRIDDLNSRLGNAFLQTLKKYVSETKKLNRELKLPEKMNTRRYNPLKKSYNNKANALATKLLAEFIEAGGESVAMHRQTLEQFKKEKERKGEVVIYEDE